MTELHSPLRVGALRQARLADGSLVDIALDGEVVAAVVESGDALEAGDGIEIDLAGALVTSAAADPHAHLDKALSWDAVDPPFGDLGRAVESWHGFSDRVTEDDIRSRARSAARRMLSQGITAVRSHVDLLPGPDPLRGVRALVALRSELAGLMDLELVALGGPTTPDEVFDRAIDEGIDLMGGVPHMADEPFVELDRLLAITRRRGVGIDLHTDERLDGPVTLGAYARAVADWDVVRSASHCVRLSTLDADELAEVVADVVRADIGIIALPITNLYLQGWDSSHSVPRGIAPLDIVRAAGGRVAAGADNVRDPFNPVGRCDPFETASLLVTAGHLAPEAAWAAVSDGARDVMALPPAGPRVGAAADLLAIDAATLGDAVAFAPAARTVIHRGRLVSRTTVRTETAQPSAALAVGSSLGK